MYLAMVLGPGKINTRQTLALGKPMVQGTENAEMEKRLQQQRGRKLLRSLEKKKSGNRSRETFAQVCRVRMCRARKWGAARADLGGGRYHVGDKP